jgi:hypothetical protein
MRLVSTALVMMTIALMLLALMLLGPAHAKSDALCSEPNKSPPNNSQTTGIENRLSSFNSRLIGPH